LTRRRLGEMAAGKRVLNLFAYTGAATVHAAGGGATSTTTVDMSNTYLDWAWRNLRLNDLDGERNELIQADCLSWLDRQREYSQRWDLMFIDPPTHSRSKRMEQDFDVQRDHVWLLQAAAQLLSPGGSIIFSNNYTRFRLDKDALTQFDIQDISRRTLPKDFERNPRIHCCFLLTLR